MFAIDANVIEIRHNGIGSILALLRKLKELLFCENETNYLKLYQFNDDKKYPKDGINDYIIHQARIY